MSVTAYLELYQFPNGTKTFVQLDSIKYIVDAEEYSVINFHGHPYDYIYVKEKYEEIYQRIKSVIKG